MNREQLFELIKRKQSFLCIGLDTDINKIPESLQSCSDPVFEFNKRIIDATHECAVAYKPNIAFYENLGAIGWLSLERTIEYLKGLGDDIFTIADAKRGDIGNTSLQYANAFLKKMDFDSITIAPYMGEDSVKPFLSYEGKWAIVLALTSNKGAYDFQFLNIDNENANKEALFEKVLKKTTEWGTTDNMMFVVGATKAEMLGKIRKIVPDHFLLVPGVGAQGGSLSEVAKYGLNDKCGLLVNSSRGIIYASQNDDFDIIAGIKAAELQLEMAEILENI